jgi:hypothetical protein
MTPEEIKEFKKILDYNSETSIEEDILACLKWIASKKAQWQEEAKLNSAKVLSELDSGAITKIIRTALVQEVIEICEGMNYKQPEHEKAWANGEYQKMATYYENIGFNQALQDCQAKIRGILS